MKRSLDINQLMKHLREQHGMTDLYGSDRKVRLRNMGYFHGYKGYRFIRKPGNEMPLSSFSDLEVIYKFDSDIKAHFYPQIMYIETTIKNVVLARVLESIDDPSLSTFLNMGLDNCRLPDGSINRTAIKQKLRLKSDLTNIVKNRYSENHIKHFVDHYDDAPLWSIFESMTLGNLSQLCQSLPAATMNLILEDLGLKGEDVKTLPSIIETLRPLRNAVAHNLVVFDARFSQAVKGTQGRQHLKTAGNLLRQRLKLTYAPEFNNVIDYICLVAVVRNLISGRSTPSKTFLNKAIKLLNNIEDTIGVDRYFKIVGSGDRQKLDATLHAL